MSDGGSDSESDEANKGSEGDASGKLPAQREDQQEEKCHDGHQREESWKPLRC
jgi:hypothetical protein